MHHEFAVRRRARIANDGGIAALDKAWRRRRIGRLVLGSIAFVRERGRGKSRDERGCKSNLGLIGHARSPPNNAALEAPCLAPAVGKLGPAVGVDNPRIMKRTVARELGLKREFAWSVRSDQCRFDFQKAPTEVVNAHECEQKKGLSVARGNKAVPISISPT